MTALLALLLAGAVSSGAGSPAAVPAGAAPCQGLVRGRIVSQDAEVAGATLDAGEKRVRADAEGRFSLRLACGPAVLLVTLESGLVQVAQAEVGPEGLELLIEVSAARFREVVEVTAPADDALPALAVRPRAVTEVAGAAENVFRLLGTLPGVAATDEFTSRLSVRGGGPDQNLTVMDGIEVHNPYRLFGLVSAFNPETVSSFELSAGAFPARHGDRLSSLLVVENRAGTERRALAGSASLALTDGNLLLEGGLPGGRGSWLVTGRRTYYDLVAERIVDDDLPSFADLQSKLLFRPGGGARLSLFALRSRESADIAFTGDRPGEQGDFLTGARNEVAAVSLEAPLGPGAFSRSAFGFTRTRERLDVDARLRAEQRRSNAPGADDGFALADVDFTRELSVRDLQARQELSWQAQPSLLLEAGAELHGLRTGVGWEIEGERNPNEANGSSLRGGTGLPDFLDSRLSGTRFGAFAQATWRPSARWTLEPGLRLDRGANAGGWDLMPRAAVGFAVSGRTRLRAAFGLHTQSPGYEKLFSADYFVDLSSAADLESERARHLLLSAEHELRGGVTLRAEAYHRRFEDLVIGRLETPAEREARLRRYDFPDALRPEIPAAAAITDEPTNGARGSAWGLDLSLVRPARSGQALSGWLAYTWGATEREAYGRRYPFDYDRPHSLSAVANLRLSDRWEIAVTARAASGFPRTPALGLRVSGLEDALDSDGDGERGEIVPERDGAGRLVYTVDRGGASNLNSGRLPFYARLDLRLTWRPRGAQGRWTFYLDVLNATARENAGRIEERLEHDPAAERPRLVEARDAALPLLPSFGVRFRF